MKPVERFLAKIEINPDTDCWEWIAGKDKYGYGVFWFGKTMKAHRWSYDYWIGDLDPDLEIDHLCRVRSCQNPDHLEQVTCKVNILRGETRAAENAAKTHCHRGHEFTDANIYIYNNHRHCRECQRERSRVWKENQHEFTRKSI